MAAVAGATGDTSLLQACKRLWKVLTSTQMHVSAGIGQIARNEGFTADYDLPNESAYLETCAAIGMAFWGHRMLDWQPDSTYSDVVEQALYNGTISGVSVTRSSRTSSRSRTASSPSIGRSSSTWPASAPPRPPRRRSKRSEAIQ